MPSLTNRSRLNPGPAPEAPPWRWLDPRTVQRWLQVSGQTLVNWRARGTGPNYRIAENARVWYRTAEVRAWLQGTGTETSRDDIIAFLGANENLWMLLGYGVNFSKAMQAEALRILVIAIKGLETLTDEDLEIMCSMIDLSAKSGAPSKRQRPKKFIENGAARRFIGYVE